MNCVVDDQSSCNTSNNCSRHFSVSWHIVGEALV